MQVFPAHKSSPSPPVPGPQLMDNTKSLIKFTGHSFFRLKIAFALLSGKPIQISNIRLLEIDPGLLSHHQTLLNLVKLITDKSNITLENKNTRLTFYPGQITGSRNLVFDCLTNKSISYYAYFLLLVLPFAKIPSRCILSGITNGDLLEYDMCIDTFKNCILPSIAPFHPKFALQSELNVKIISRGAAPLGGGKIEFIIPNVEELNPIKMISRGKFAKIRGVAYCTRVSPQFASRMIIGARKLLDSLDTDVRIYPDPNHGNSAGKSPGFGLSLCALSENNGMVSSELEGAPGIVPEAVGIQCAKQLILLLSQSGMIDTLAQPIVLMFMILNKDKKSSILMEKLSPAGKETEQLLNQFFGMKFKKSNTETGQVLVQGYGYGYRNLGISSR